MVLIEKSFPRGGNPKQSVKNESKNIVFGARQNKKHKSLSEKEKTEDALNLHSDIEAVSAELLNYKTVQEGMILIGYIDNIGATYLKIALPGRITGQVPLSLISESYAKNLYHEKSDATANYKKLNELFSIGQKIYTKVMKIQKTEFGRIDIELSIKPKDVHSNMSHNNMKKGMILNGAIEEVQEHGYVIETGIKNFRCFLPFDKITNINKQQYEVGQLIFIKLEKLTKASQATTAIGKEIKENQHKVKDLIEPKLEYLLPTSIVHFTITKILKDGLQGTIMNGNFTAYCNEHYLSNPLSLPTDYDLNTTHNAQILYVMPITKLVYLTLNINNEYKNNDNHDEIPFKKGDIIDNAIVDRIGTGGVILKINDVYKGLISFKSIKSKLISNYDQDELLSKYYKNSKHKVRVITYDPIESLFICSDNPSDINEKYYAITDLEIGALVNGIVEETNKTNNEGYFIKIGKIRGYIEKLYLSPVTANLSENSKIRCRVIARNPQRNMVYLTNRPEYMSKTLKILKNYSQAKTNRIYVGTIVKCNEKNIIVKFFNNIRGILYKKNNDELLNKQRFYEGQTMNFIVVSCNEEKLILSLVEDSCKMGEICSGKIAHIMEDGLDIILDKKIDDNDVDDDDNDESNYNQLRGLIPTRLLSEFQDLITLHLKSFHINKKLKEIVCIEKNVFSLRDANYYKYNPIKYWKDIQIGDVLRGYIKNVENDIIEIFLPIHDYNKLIKIHMNMLITDTYENTKTNFIELYPEQIVYVKILSKVKLNKMKTITISAKLTDVWNGDLYETGNLFAKYLDELNLIKNSLKNKQNNNNKTLRNFQIGECCTAKIIEYDDNNEICHLQIINDNDDNDITKNNIHGIIKYSMLLKKDTLNKKLPINHKLKCIILWIDYLNEIIYLSNNSHDLQHITKGHQLPLNFKNKTGLNAKILLITKDVIVCSLKKGCNPLIFVPTKLHYNDFNPQSIKYGINEGQFCRLSMIHNNYSIGIFENIWKFWHEIEIKGRKRKISENENEIKMSEINVKKSKIEIKMNKNDNDKKEISVNKINKTKQINYVSLIKKHQSEDELSVEEDQTSEKKSTNFVSLISKNRSEDELSVEKDQMPQKKQKEKSNNKKRQISHEPNSNEILSEDQSKKLKEDKTDNKEISVTNLKLPGPSNFWSNNSIQSLNTKLNEENSSDDDDDDNDNSKINSDNNKKKKKLTSAEKFQIAREEESRLREIEEKYADPNMQPETAEQFERLVLSKPNDSKIWINYMVFHLQQTEIDKARLIARKALKAISFREEQELINIWVALLNLELRYGTKETFNDIFKESVMCNDSYKIHTRVLRILSDAKKLQELNDLIIICTKKFKDKPELWKNAAIAYFDVGQHEKGKQLLHKALNVLPEREHINTIVTFANLNHKYGDKEQAHALFEQIITSYPKRVDIWSQYVDMLIKDEKYESARQTLERAIIQKIPLKKMRTLFKKYLDFEEKYGTEENVLKVKEIAANYVQKEIGS